MIWGSIWKNSIFLLYALTGHCYQMLDVGEQCYTGYYGPSTQYYFNSLSLRCERFDYKGCGGNENRFVDEESCNKGCIYVRDGKYDKFAEGSCFLWRKTLLVLYLIYWTWLKPPFCQNKKKNKKMGIACDKLIQSFIFSLKWLSIVRRAASDDFI